MRYVRTIICLLLVVLSGIYWQSYGAGGTVRLLISRPNNFGYTVDQKTIWVAAVTESFLYFKLDAIDKCKVIPMDKITPLISAHRKFEKRVTLNKYENAAKELTATHILYSEYEILPGKKGVKIYFSVEAVDKSRKSQKTQIRAPLGGLNESLSNAVREIALMLGISKNDLPEEILKLNVLGSNSKNTQRLGNYLKVESKADKVAFSMNAQSCERIISEDSEMYLAYFAGSRLYALAGKSDKAVILMQTLVDRLGSKYPKLYLLLATYYRKSAKLNEAKNAIDRIARNPNLKAAVLWEQGLIYVAMRKRAEALSSFQSLLNIERSDPNVYLHLAKINIALNRAGRAEKNVEEAAKLSGKPAGKIYFEIGNEFVKEKDNTNAMKVYKKSTKLTPDNEEAWSALIDLQKKESLDSVAAMSCLSLFQLDIIKYESYLEKAGLLLEQHGSIDMARQVYAVAFEKHSNPKFAILLARLEFKQKNCSRVKDILEVLGPPWDKDREVIAMLDKCYEDKVPPQITLNGPDPFIIEAGSADYIEPGATAADDVDGDLTHFIKVTGKVNTSVVDTYMVTYTVTDASNNRATKTRTVVISDDNPPVLELIGPVGVKLEFGDRYDEGGAMAMDSRDGDLTSKIKISGKVNPNVAGVYTLTYSVSDKSGNTATQTRTVTVSGDVTPPEMTLVGSTPMYLKVGERYKEQGCRAIDKVDGDLTKQRLIQVKGRVNSMVPGSYKIVYSARDKAGNVATAERVVNVLAEDTKIDKTPPVITLIGGTQKDIIYVGEEYEEPGVNAIDKVDGDITAYIKIEGEINPTLPGDYAIKYTAIDKSGNKTVKVVRVKVRKRGERYRKERMASIKRKTRKDATKKQTVHQETQTGLGLKKREGRKKALVALLTGAGGIGMGALGYLLDTKIPGYKEEWDEIYGKWKYEVDSDKKADFQKELDAKRNDIDKIRNLRTLCYLGGSALSIGFTINLAIPKVRKK